MAAKLYAINPDRELTDVVIEGWPVIISKGVAAGYLPICPHHQMNMTRRDEIHLSQADWFALTLNLYAYDRLAFKIQLLDKTKDHEPHKENTDT